MRREMLLACCLLVALASLLLSAAPCAHAENVRPLLITQNVDESTLVTLGGNTRPEAKAKYDRGRVDDNLQMEHLLLLLKRSPEQEQELDKLIEDLHDSSSPNFHRWLNPQDFGDRFGVSKQDRETIKNWLQSHGLKVNVDYPNGLLIDFSGTAGQLREALHTEIHSLNVKGEKHIANMSDPQIPAALAPAVTGVVSLHDFRPHTNYKSRAEYSVTKSGAKYYLVVPGDLETIYNINPLFSAGITGVGQTIVAVEDTDIYTADDWTSFRSVFGLSSYTGATLTQTHPAPPSGTNNCADPGENGDDREAIVDAEYASAAAPSAAIVLASCANAGTFGGLIAIQNIVNAGSTPPLLSMSYGECEANSGATMNAAFNSAFQQAVTEGISVFVSSGDDASAGCGRGQLDNPYGIGISGWTSSPYDVSVGGTDFGDTFAGTNATYWKTTNSKTYESAKSYIPEIPWNDSCASLLIAEFEGFSQTYGPSGFCNSSKGDTNLLNTIGGSGGPSGCATGTPSSSGVVSGTCAGWPKPSYQSILGNPNDGVRDIPDVSLFAADGPWLHYYPYCYSGSTGVPCTQAPVNWPGAGGTSFTAPIMAGIQALVNQKAGARQGNPNYVYYTLAGAQYGTTGDKTCNSTLGNGVSSACIFYDVTQGDNDVSCIGKVNCYQPGGANGVQSTSNTDYQPAFATNTGWDFPTGIGSVNAYNLVMNWPVTEPPVITSADHTTFVVGTAGSFTVGTAGIPVPSLSEAGTLPAGVTFVDHGGSGTLSGTPTAGGVFSISFTAQNGIGSPVTQPFTLTVNQAPAITSASSTTFTVGAAGSFTVNATGIPSPSIGETGALPAGVTFIDNGNGTGTLSGTPIATGTFSISFTAQNGVGSPATQTFTLTVGKGSQTITFTTNAPASAAYNSTFTVAATGGGSGNPVTFTSAGSCSNAGAVYTMTSGTGTCSVIANQAGNTNYLAAPQLTETVSATPATQTITFTTNAPASVPYNSNFTVAATASSGLAVAYSSAGTCSNAGAVYTMTSGTGTCSVIANQAGNGNYSAAPQVTQTVNATLAAQTITFTTNAPASAPYNSNFTVAATASSGLAVVYSSTGVCSNAGATYTMTSGTGACSVIANQPGNGNYAAAPQVMQTVNATLAAQTITFTTSAPVTAPYNSNFTVAATASSGLAVVYSSSGVCSNAGATYTMTSGTGTCSVIANQPGNGNYSAAPQVTQTTKATLASQTIAFTTSAPATAPYNSSFTVAATASSGLAVVYSSSGVCSNAGTTYTMTSGTGTCSVIANQPGNANYSAAPQVTQTTKATLATQTITFTTNAPASAPYNSSFTVAATGGSSGNPVVFTSSGSCSNAGATYTITSGTGTCSVIANQAGNTNYSAAPQVTETAAATPASQTITFTTNAPASAVYGSNFTVEAKASSGLAVAYSSAGACSNAGATYTMTSGTGTCSVIANQPGNANYSAAPQVTEAVTATPAAQTITFTTNAPASAPYNSNFTVAATASSGLAVVYTSAGSCSNAGATYTMTSGTGTCSAIANQPGNGNYAAAPQVTQTTKATLASQTITFTTSAPASAPYNSNFTVAATASSGLAVVYTSSGVCSNAGATYTMTSGTGNCSVIANQPGNGNYAAATQVTQTTKATLASQAITFTTNAPASAPYNSSFTVAATGGGSGNAVVFTSSGSCSNAGATYTMTSGTGTCSVIANQAGNSNYSAAPQVTETVNATLATQTITFTTSAPASAPYNSTFTVAATASSGLAVVYTSAGSCSNAGATYTITSGTGTCSVIANQPGNANYQAAPQVTQTVNATPAPQTITFTTNAPASAVYGSNFTVAAKSSSGLAVVYTSAGSCSNSGATYTMTSGTGTCSVIVNQPGNGNYAAAPQVTQTVNATPAAQTITFTTNAPASAVYGSNFTVAAKSSSGLAVVYTSAGACSNASATYTMTSGTGTCSVIANQPGNGNYAAAPQVTQTVNATLAAQTITFTTNAPASAGYNSSFTVAATASSGLAVVYSSSGVCSNAGATYTMTSGTGTCSVIANQPGNANYSAAPQVTQTVKATLATQTITFTTNAPASAPYNSSFTVAATGGGSGNPVVFTSSGSCSNAGATYTITSGTGTCSVIANQAGNSNYSAAPQVTQTVNATPASQTITFTTNAPASAGYGSSFTVAATASSGLAVAYSSAGACSNAGATYTMTSGTGTCSVIANQAGNANYSAAPQVTETVTATLATQTITFTTNAPASAVYGSNFTVVAKASSGLAVVYTSSGACSNAGATYTMTSGTGTCTVIANQPGNGSYLPAPQVTETTAATKKAQTITFSVDAPASAPYQSSFTVVAAASSGLAVVYSSSGVCSNAGATYTMTAAAGKCTVNANQPGDSNYSAATQVTESTTAVKAKPTVSLTGAPATAPYQSSFTVTATTNASTKAVITATGGNCTISGKTVTMTKGTGTCIVTAKWATDIHYLAAAATEDTVAEKLATTLKWPTPAAIVYGTALSATQLDATAFYNSTQLTGSFVYTLPVGRVLVAGSSTLSVKFTPTLVADYTTVTDAVTLVVNKIGTTTKITSTTPAAPTVGVAVSVHFSVTAGYGKPTQTVTVTSTTGETCSATLASGVGTCAITFATAGTRTLTAAYSGDANDLASTSAGFSLKVNP